MVARARTRTQRAEATGRQIKAQHKINHHNGHRPKRSELFHKGSELPILGGYQAEADYLPVQGTVEGFEELTRGLLRFLLKPRF